MKPPPRTRKKPDRNLNPEPSPSARKLAGQWQRAEQRNLLKGLRALRKISRSHGDIDCALLKKYVPTRSTSEIQSVVEYLKDKVISMASFKLKKKKWEEKKVKKPIEVWTRMASSIAGTLEETISSAFSQMLMVSSTEPRTLRNCDPPQVYRPPTDEAVLAGRTVPMRPMPRLPAKAERCGSNTVRPVIVLKTPGPARGPAKRLPGPSQVVKVANGNIPPPQQALSTTAGISPAATPTFQSAAPPTFTPTLQSAATPTFTPTFQSAATPTLQSALTLTSQSPPTLTSQSAATPTFTPTSQSAATPTLQSALTLTSQSPPTLTSQSAATPTFTPTSQSAATPCQTGATKILVVPSTSLQPASQSPVTGQVAPSSDSAAAGNSLIQTTQQPVEQHPTATSTTKSTSSGPHMSLSVSATGQTPGPSTAPSPGASSASPAPPLSTPASALHNKFGRTSKYATKDSPRMLGVQSIVDFERIYRYLSIIHQPNEECHLTPMESAIVLDLLMSLPEELPLLDCNKLHKHLIQVYRFLSSTADSKKAAEMFKALKDGLCAQAVEPSSGDGNRTNSQTAGTSDSGGGGGGKTPQPDEPVSQSSGSNNTSGQSEVTDVMELCLPLNPFMVPLKLLVRK